MSTNTPIEHECRCSNTSSADVIKQAKQLIADAWDVDLSEVDVVVKLMMKLTHAREAQATLLTAAQQARSYMERVENLGQGAIPSVEYQDLDTAIKNLESDET